MFEKDIRPIERFWYVSPLTRRILAVNVAALLVLVLGLLYTGRYERGLVAAELDALTTRGRLYAAVIAEHGSALPAGNPEALHLSFLSADGQARILVFGPAGEALFDSGGKPSGQTARTLADRLAARLPGALSFPLFSTAQGWPGAAEARRGRESADAWRTAQGGLLLTAALPVPGIDGKTGAIVLARDGQTVRDAVRDVRLTVLRAFLFALLITVLLTIYLSEAIVYPIVRLARATERVRQNPLHRDSLPDLSWRKDEIGDLSRAFLDMTAALEARIDSISRFAADVAHEIRNPLASVQSAVDAYPVVRDEAQRQRLLAVIHDDVNRMTRLITDISNASRLDSELSRAERRPLDLAALLKDVVAEEGARLEDPEKIVLYAEEGRRLPITGNDVQLAQVTHNLIDNALSFVTETGKVVVSAGLKDDKIYMHVDNAGPPIPEDKLEAVFERFYSERPRSEKFGLHSGLGLSISRQIVRMHGGDITARNLKDKSGAPQGVRFTVLLPAGAGTK